MKKDDKIITNKKSLSINSPLRSPKKIKKKNFSLSRTITDNVINKAKVLENLNNLLGADHKKINFRMSKAKFHELLTNRYGFEVITNFFGMQSLEDFDGMIKII